MVTAVATILAPIERNPRNVPTVVPQAIDRSGAVVDLGAQADRLKTKLAEVTAYRQPARDAFRFAPPPRRVVESPPTVSVVSPPVVSTSGPPYGLAGMATSTDNGVVQRTAILSSLQGVALVKEGDVLDTGYKVLSIADDSVTLASTVDGTQTTLRLSSSDSR